MVRKHSDKFFANGKEAQWYGGLLVRRFSGNLRRPSGNEA